MKRISHRYVLIMEVKMKKRTSFDDKMILEKYLKGKSEEDDTLGDLVVTLIRKFSDTRYKEDRLQIVLSILLLILSGEEYE